MKLGRTHSDYLDDILDASEKVRQFTAGMDDEEFSKDARTIFAVIRAFEIIGEATKQLSDSFKYGIRNCRGARWPVCAIN